jgi:serine/threonine protein kinase
MIKVLRQGEFDVIHFARDRRTGENVLVRVLADLGDESLGLFFREVQVLCSVSHPTLIGFRGFIFPGSGDKERPAIVTEFMAGGSLREVIDAGRKGKAPGGWDETQKLICLYGVAKGMMILHRHRIIHRHFKPDNVLLTEDLEPKI